MPPSLSALITAAAIPGTALATIANGKVVLQSFGVTTHSTPDPVTDATIFDVASLSKPVAACIALQLADRGLLDLDRPLSDMVQQGVGPQVAAAPITAQHVLTHTSGLPNLRGAAPPQVHFAPGSRFSYSSMGFAYLQLAMEAVTGEPLEALAQRLLFAPLGMASSSFQWHDRFSASVASPHEGTQPLAKHRPAVGHASYSLQTTVADYARFMLAVLDGALLQASTAHACLTPVVGVPQGTAEDLGPAATPPDPGLAWGLGWGLEAAGDCFFQWGKMDGVRALAMGHRPSRSAVVLLTNSNRGLRLMEAAVQGVLPGLHPALTWLQACVTE